MKRMLYEPLALSSKPTLQHSDHTHEVHSTHGGVTVVTKHWSQHEARLERDWQKKLGVVAEVVEKQQRDPRHCDVGLFANYRWGSSMNLFRMSPSR